MKIFTKLCVLCILGLFVISSSQAAPKAKEKPKPAKACVSTIHIIQGCSACEAMKEWLGKGGVELDITSVQQGAYAMYPTVVYSDKFVDHGERMYKQEVVIPQKICVISCSIGMN